MRSLAIFSGLLLMATTIAAGETPVTTPRLPSGRVAGSCPPPLMPPPLGDRLILGAAGAPVVLFGDPTEPQFEEVFALLADAGFDLFFPYFGVRETETGSEVTGHFEHFLPPELLPPGTPLERSCVAGPNQS